VRKDRQDTPMRKLEVSVRVDREKLLLKLGELAIGLQQPQNNGNEALNAGTSSGPPANSAVVVGQLQFLDAAGKVSDTIELGVATNGADHGGNNRSWDVLAELEAAMGGWDLREPSTDIKWPVTDPQAQALAATAGTTGTLVAKVSVFLPTYVRGAGRMQVGRAKLRLVSAAGVVLGNADDSVVAASEVRLSALLTTSVATLLNRGSSIGTVLTAETTSRLLASQIAVPPSSSDVRTALVLAAPAHVVAALAASLGGQLTSVLPNGYVVRVRRPDSLQKISAAVRQFSAAEGRFAAQVKGDVVVARWEVNK
jgi:hypothetical protein